MNKTLEEIIRELCGTYVPVLGFDRSIKGFSYYLNSHHIKHFSAQEACIAHKPEVAIAAGYPGGYLIPPQDWWERGVACIALADKLREKSGLPIGLRNWWRPKDYNDAVGGADGSDHLTAHAVDLDCSSKEHREVCEKLLIPYWLDSGYRLSLGLSKSKPLGLSGGVTIHLGIHSPVGRRMWYYGSIGTLGPCGKLKNQRPIQ